MNHFVLKMLQVFSHMSFFYKILTRKFGKTFLVKLSYKTHVLSLLQFQDEKIHLFVLQNKSSGAKMLNNDISLYNIHYIIILNLFQLYFTHVSIMRINLYILLL